MEKEMEDTLFLSALNHYLYCPRRCALIHIEQMWTENVFTAEGRIMHTNVHEEGIQNLKNIRVERGVLLRSFEFGLIGKADVVEFHKVEGGKQWLPFPVEYKHGKPKQNNCDKVQLCAQALCLEEMLKTRIECGALFYGKTRHRLDVVFDDVLRDETREVVKQLRIFIEAGKTPAPVYTPKCKSCSFFEECLPRTISRKISAKLYLEKEMEEMLKE
jgi:CRISPR-associated exonuclease Cas4